MKVLKLFSTSFRVAENTVMEKGDRIKHRYHSKQVTVCMSCQRWKSLVFLDN